ncbi:MAG TPA: TIGR03088 family PEP-CTERM/XrtA system glycosyltransferase [Candidatus Eisenbacteria bacterium]
MTGDRRPLVLHVIHHLGVGGLETGLVNLINRMSVEAYRHAIACIEDASSFRDRLTRPDVEIVALNRSRIGHARLRLELFRLCRTLRPAIVHTRNLSGLDALLPARLAGVPWRVHGEHGRDSDDVLGQNRKLALLRRVHAPLVHRYITVSKDLRRYLVRRVGIREDRITQIYNGVDTGVFFPATEPSRGLFPDRLVHGNPTVFGTVGRMDAVKDQATLLRAFAGLARSASPHGASARLALIGDGPLLAELRGLAEALGIADRVWFPGSLDRIPEALRGFDVFVLPSLFEGISNTILEAMASGVPIVATAVGGNAELVEDGVVGRLFRPGDVDGLTRLLVEYAADPDLRRRHAAAARRLAVDRFDLGTMVRRYVQVYESRR